MYLLYLYFIAFIIQNAGNTTANKAVISYVSFQPVDCTYFTQQNHSCLMDP